MLNVNLFIGNLRLLFHRDGSLNFLRRICEKIRCFILQIDLFLEGLLRWLRADGLGLLELRKLGVFLELLMLMMQPGFYFVSAAGMGPLLVSNLFHSIEAVERAANGASIIIADAELLGCQLDRDLIMVNHVKELLALGVSDLFILSHHRVYIVENEIIICDY